LSTTVNTVNQCQPIAEAEAEAKKEKYQEKVEEIYEAYPRHVAKAEALKAIEKAIKIVSPEILLELTKKYSRQIVGKDPQFTPYPSTWFNQRRWEDVGQVQEQTKRSGPRTAEEILDDETASIDEITSLTHEQQAAFVRRHIAT